MAYWNPTTDQVLAAQNGDPVELQSIIENSYDAVRRFLFRFNSLPVEDTEDVVSLTIIRAWYYLNQFDTARGGKFTTWLLTIAHNQYNTEYRQRKNLLRRSTSLDKEGNPNFKGSETGTFQDILLSEVPTPQQKIENEELSEIIGEAIEGVEPAYVEALKLRELDNLSYEEIAEILGIPKGTVKSKIFRGREQVMEYIRFRYHEYTL